MNPNTINQYYKIFGDAICKSKIIQLGKVRIVELYQKLFFISIFFSSFFSSLNLSNFYWEFCRNKAENFITVIKVSDALIYGIINRNAEDAYTHLRFLVAD